MISASKSVLRSPKARATRAEPPEPDHFRYLRTPGPRVGRLPVVATVSQSSLGPGRAVTLVDSGDKPAALSTGAP
jgi:hypothetical protein